MPLVRALKTVFLAPDQGGYHLEGEEFLYDGPANDNLVEISKDPQEAYVPDKIIPSTMTFDHEPIPTGDEVDDPEDDKDTAYHGKSADDLKAELNKRGVQYASNASQKRLRQYLEQDDASKAKNAQKIDIVADETK